MERYQSRVQPVFGFIFCFSILILGIFGIDDNGSERRLDRLLQNEGELISVRNSRSLSHAHGYSHAMDDILITITIDGTIAALDVNSGDVLWMFEMDKPLLSSAQGPDQSSRPQVFPGIDGSLFVLSHSEKHKIDRLPVTVADLVESSPSLTDDGSVVLGRITSSLYYLDSTTGELIKSFTDESTHKNIDVELDYRQAVLIGCRNYVVSSHDQKTGTVQWNVTFSDMSYLNVNNLGIDLADFLEGKLSPKISVDAKGEFRLMLGKGNSIIASDESVHWQSPSFKTPPVIIFSSKYPGVNLLPNQLNMSNQRGYSGHKQISYIPNIVLVGRNQGGMYAMAAPVENISGRRVSVQELPGSGEDSSGASSSSDMVLEGGELVEVLEGSQSEMDALVCALGEMKTKDVMESLPWLLNTVQNQPNTNDKFSYMIMVIAILVSFVGGAGTFAFLRLRAHKNRTPCASLQTLKRLKSFEPGSPGNSIASFNATASSSFARSIDSQSTMSRSTTSLGTLNKKEFRHNGILQIGQLTVGPGILGFGTAGTVVFEGIFHDRPVAVKRILKQFYDMAANEKDLLIVSDEHPNLVRMYAMEEDEEFIYLALERCERNLADFIASESGHPMLVEPCGKPSTYCMQLLLEITQGLAALHDRGIVHRDLKPQNILMTEGGHVKLSDMGLGRRLVPDQSSFYSSGCGGSSGWQSPEQLLIREGGAARQTKAMDIFSLGCIMYQTITVGRHPFGDSSYSRDNNILKGKFHLDGLENFPEALDLISSMLNTDEKYRPSIESVLSHPFWWSARRKLNFLIDLSDRVENEDRQEQKTLLRAFESYATRATGGNWGARLDPLLVKNLGQYRKYAFTGLRDLLRVIRNKHNHYRELPSDLKKMMGCLPDDFYKYFSSRFPDLLMTTYSFVKTYVADEPPMDKYFTRALGNRISDPESVSTPSSMPTIEEEDNTSPMHATEEVETFNTELVSDVQATIRTEPPKLKVKTKLPSVMIRSGSLDAAMNQPNLMGAVRAAPNTGTPWDAVLNVIFENASQNVAEQERREISGMDRSKSLGNPSILYSPTQAQDFYSPHTKGSSYSSVQTQPRSPIDAYQPHPRGFDSLINTDRQAEKSPDLYKDLQSPIRISDSAKKYENPTKPIVGWEEDPENNKYTLLPFPQRPGAPICDFYLKTGFCKYHEKCRFHHPSDRAIRLNEDGLPVRPGEPTCEFYKNTHQCKFGGACKFNHPNMKPIFAGSVVN